MLPVYYPAVLTAWAWSIAWSIAWAIALQKLRRGETFGRDVRHDCWQQKGANHRRQLQQHVSGLGGRPDDWCNHVSGGGVVRSSDEPAQSACRVHVGATFDGGPGRMHGNGPRGLWAHHKPGLPRLLCCDRIRKRPAWPLQLERGKWLVCREVGRAQRSGRVLQTAEPRTAGAGGLVFGFLNVSGGVPSWAIVGCCLLLTKNCG
jgi:hypothetical protein